MRNICIDCRLEFDDDKLVARDGAGYWVCAECFEKRRAKRRQIWLTQSGLPEALRSKSFANFNPKKQPAAYQAVCSGPIRSLILYSPNAFGVGKTHLLAGLVNRVITESEPFPFKADKYMGLGAPCPVYYTTEFDLVRRLRSVYDPEHKETEAEIYQQLESVNVLIIDDVGKVQPQNPAFVQGIYYQIMDVRYLNNKPLIISTNLTLEELGVHVGGAAEDRLFGLCSDEDTIGMMGESYRNPSKA